MTVPLKDRRRTVFQVIALAFAEEEGHLSPADEQLFRQIVDLAEKRRHGHVSPAVSDLTKRRDLLEAGPSYSHALNLVAYSIECMAAAAQISSATVAAKLRELRQDFTKMVSSTKVAPPPPPGGWFSTKPPKSDLP